MFRASEFRNYLAELLKKAQNKVGRRLLAVLHKQMPHRQNCWSLIPLLLQRVADA
jgi:hypothetical protein